MVIVVIEVITMRGRLTDEINEVAMKFLGRQITVIELRLYPYLDYVMKNEQKLKIERINQEERDVLKMLKQAGHIEGGIMGLSMTKEFYDYIQDVLWLGYVIGGSDGYNC